MGMSASQNYNPTMGGEYHRAIVATLRTAIYILGQGNIKYKLMHGNDMAQDKDGYACPSTSHKARHISLDGLLRRASDTLGGFNNGDIAAGFLCLFILPNRPQFISVYEDSAKPRQETIINKLETAADICELLAVLHDNNTHTKGE